MAKNFVFLGLFIAVLTGSVGAQQPDAKPPAPAQQGDALRRAFVEADGSRGVMTAAVEQMSAEGGASTRAKFLTTLRAIAAVAPKPDATPPAKPDPQAPPPPAPKPVEFADATKQLMATVVTGDAESSKAALAKLATEPDGPAAIARLDERGKAVLARWVVLTVRRKIDTNAVFAGQYDELKEFAPESTELLLRWAQVPPKDAARADEFRVACLRAVRDVLPADQATDATRAALREIAGKAQHAGNQNLLLTAACALHQYGDPSLFDQMKAQVEKGLTAEKEEQRTGAASLLAELHYQLREYEQAATYYKSAVEMLEKAATPPQNLATTIYNAACSLSLAKKTDEALQFLEKALQVAAKGRALSKAMIDADHDMNNLRGEARFAQLMEQYFGKGAGTK